MDVFHAEVSIFILLWTLWRKNHYQPVDLLKRLYKSIAHRPVPKKFTKKFPEIKTGLSDFYKLIVTHWKYTNSAKNNFINEISFNLPRIYQELTLEDFISMFKIVFEKHNPLKKQYVGASHSKFVTKELSEAITLIISSERQWSQFSVVKWNLKIALL